MTSKTTVDQHPRSTDSKSLIFTLEEYLGSGISKHFVGLMLIIIFTGLITMLASSREFFTYGTETDYLGGFVPEAQRFIEGKPLLMEFHPPFYSLTIATIQQIFSDWFVTGLVVSLGASIIALTANYFLFHLIGGVRLAIGALAALMVSPVFMEYSVQATSDVFFFAVYSLTLLLVLLGSKERSVFIWILGGLFVALTILTRTNGFVLLPLLLFPWLEKSDDLSAFKRSKWFGWMLIAFLLVMIGWVTFTTRLDSPAWPTKTYESFALTYYSPDSDRHSGDNRRVSSEQFDSTWEIISYDPVHIAKTYLSDLLLLARKVFAANHTIIFPMGLLALLGALSTFFPDGRPFEFIRSQRFFILYLLLTAAHMFGINFRAFHERFYLFLVPFLGALVALGIQKAFILTRWKLIRYTVILSALVIFIYGITISISRAHDAAHRNDIELSQVVPILNDVGIDPASIIIARKPHIPFYANSQPMFFPDVNNLDELQNAIAVELSQFQQVYLYYGGVEKLARPQLQQLQFPENNPSWLVPVAGGEKQGWVLYRVELHNDS